MRKTLIRPTDAEDAAINAAALSDPDNQPLTAEQLAQFKGPSQKTEKIVR